MTSDRRWEAWLTRCSNAIYRKCHASNVYPTSYTQRLPDVILRRSFTKAVIRTASDDSCGEGLGTRLPGDNALYTYSRSGSGEPSFRPTHVRVIREKEAVVVEDRRTDRSLENGIQNSIQNVLSTKRIR